jgi:hypothetical protein
MAKYLFQASYTSEAWAAQLQNPQNRVEILRPIVERLGGLSAPTLPLGSRTPS